MKSKKLKRFSIFTAAFIAVNLLAQGFAGLFSDVSHKIVHAIEGNSVYFEQSSVETTNTNLIYVDLVAKGEQGDVISVTYKTYSGTAIQDIDYKGVENNISLTIEKNKTEATYKIAIKCLNDANSREKLRLYDKTTTYGRYFNLKITDAKNATIDTERDTCKCYLAYANKAEATIDADNDQTFGSKISYISDYKTMLLQNESGTNIDGGSTRKSWQHGVSFNNETTQRWINAYINNGLANAYGSMVAEKIDDSTGSKWTAGQGKVSLLMGNREFIEKYDRDKKCPGLLMYGKINPPGTRLNGKAMHYISQWVNPYDKDKGLIDISIYTVAESHYQIYFTPDRNTWFASKNSIYDSEFYKINPYNGILDLGAACYNHNDEADMIYKNIWLMMTLYDNTAPVITSQYSEYNSENGTLRIYLRFSEPVYATRKTNSSLTVKINGYNTEYQAKYVDGNYSDTLVYEIKKDDVPKINITSVKYTLPNDDIADMAYILDYYKIIRNNKVQNTSQQREATIIGNIIDLSQPLINVDVSTSGNKPNNFYNIVLSANDNGNREFNTGTVYYSWTHSDTIENPTSPLSYKYSHVLTSEEKGSFTVSLMKNEAAEITSGTYYLHALAVSPYGFQNYKTFGPYILDGDAPNVIGVNFFKNELQTKTIDLQISKKAMKNVILNVKYKDNLGAEKYKTQFFVENGVVNPSLKSKGILNDIDDGTTITYRYKSNIDSNNHDVEIDTFIKELMGTKERFDLDFYYNLEDIAGNKSTTDTYHLTYDIRDLFTPKVTVPASYTSVSDITLGTDVYNIANAGENEGIKFSINLEDATLKGYIDDGAKFSVDINNGERVIEANSGDKYFVILSDLEPGYYDVVSKISGTLTSTSTAISLISKSTVFYLTNNKEDKTTNKEKIDGNLVLSNKVFQLEDARFYYFNTAASSVENHLYGATYSEYGSKYEGGSTTPTFSSSIEAKKYLKYMEYQDLYLISISETIASLLNSGTGSTVYIKATGETRNAQAGQLWVRYKKNTWTASVGASGWAFYYYGEGNVEDGININTLSPNLSGAIEMVVNRILGEGQDTNLVQEGDIKQTTGEPYLSEGQMHINVETVDESKSGTPFIYKPVYNGDPNLYQNTIKIGEETYPLATNMALSVDSSTSLYYKEQQAGEWKPLEAKDGQLLKDALKNQATGVYMIREYAKGGVSEFSFYLDKSLPTLNVTKDKDLESEAVLDLDGKITNLTCKSLTLNSLNSEADPQAYVAIYSYPDKTLKKVLYQNEIADYVLSNGNFYIQVGDRSGNIATYTLLTSDSQIELDVSENEAKTAVIVKVNNRSDSEIYSYEVYLNETLIDSDFASSKYYRESGIYRIEVMDIYGNKETRIISHESPSPDITWYYLNENDSYSVYDPLKPVRMILEEDSTSPRTTNVYSSTLVKLQFKDNYQSGNVKFELLDIEEKDYTYNDSTGLLSINSLTGWRLRVWYEDQPEIDHIYVFHLDNSAPEVIASFIGNSFNQLVTYDEDTGKMTSTASFDTIDYSKYQVGDAVNLDNLKYKVDGTTTIPFENNAVISGSHIVIQVSDPSGIRDDFTITRNGQPLDMKFNLDNKLLINSYGYYVLTFTDKLGNVTTFKFTNVDGPIAEAFIDADIIEQDKLSYGHDEIVIKTLYEGQNTFLLRYGDKVETYVFVNDGKTVIFGQYIVKEGGVDEEEETIVGKYSEFVATKFSLDVNLDNTRVNTWYPAITKDDYVVSVMIDDNLNVYYKVACIEKDINVESNFTTGKNHLPNRYLATLSKEIPSIVLLTGDEVVEQKAELEYIYIAEDLTIKPDSVSNNIKTIEYCRSDKPEFEEFITIYKDNKFVKEFVGHEDGFYQIIVTNIYNNKTSYLLSKIDSFASVVNIHTLDGSTVTYYDNTGTICANESIELIVYSDSVYFIVNNQITSGYLDKGTIILELTREGTYDVRVVGENGIHEDFKFEINSIEEFVYKDEWITGYNEKALLKDQGYTNTNCSINLGKDVVFIDMVVNDENHIVLYDNITSNKQTDLEILKEVIGKYGVGKYTVGFRNKYGDLVTHTVYFNNVPSLVLDRITTSDPSVYESYDLAFAVEKDFYSNYVLRFSTSSTNYIFTINGERYRLDEPKSIEFSNASGNGSFSYEVTYLDEYGNDISFNAILLRQDLTIDVSKMNVLTLGAALYTRDDICVIFGEGLKATVSIDSKPAVDYTSGYMYYGDGEYAFVIRDIAGNRVFYTINHKSMNHYSLLNTSTNEAIIFGGVVNNANVRFAPTDGSKLKYVFRNGELIENYTSSSFTQTGYWQLLIVDDIGNQSYEEFYILNNSLSEFTYNAPFDYEVTEVWRVDPDGGREILNYRGPSITLNQNGDYVVVVTSTKTISSFNFSVTINDTPPSAKLNGVDNNGITAKDVTITGLRVGDVVKVYKDGVLISTTTVALSSDAPTISAGGKYRVTVTNVQGVTIEYNFVRKAVTNVAGSIFVIVASSLLMVGIGFGLFYHTKLKTDD